MPPVKPCHRCLFFIFIQLVSGGMSGGFGVCHRFGATVAVGAVASDITTGFDTVIALFVFAFFLAVARLRRWHGVGIPQAFDQRLRRWQYRFACNFLLFQNDPPTTWLALSGFQVHDEAIVPCDDQSAACRALIGGAVWIPPLPIVGR